MSAINIFQKVFVMKNRTLPFKRFEFCVPVRGKRRSIICDIQRRRFKFIPNILFEILALYDGKKIEEVKQNYDSQYHSIIDQYFDFLLKEEFIFFTHNPELFPSININMEEVMLIHNALVDIENENGLMNAQTFIKQLQGLGCKHLQIRVFKPVSIAFIDALLSSTKDSCLRSVEIILAYNSVFDNQAFVHLLKDYAVVSRIILHGLPNYESFTKLKGNISNMFYSPQTIDGKSHCGIIDPQFFTINAPMFLEAQHYNTCLNRKISMDTEGSIRNCPSLPQSFGSIKNTSLKEVVELSDFKKYWSINKDMITVCQDCEFRYICTDCRAYVENPDDIYSKPLKCGYDPNTGEWEDWSTNPIKKEAIEFYTNEENPF